MPGYAGDKKQVLTRLRRIEGQVRGIGLNRSKRPPTGTPSRRVCLLWWRWSCLLPVAIPPQPPQRLALSQRSTTLTCDSCKP